MSQLHEAHSGSDDLFRTRLLSVSSDAKTVKGFKFGWLTGIQYLDPGSPDICPNAGLCFSVCLDKAGRNAMSNAEKARLKRTEMFREHRHVYFNKLDRELSCLSSGAHRLGVGAAARLNGTSDIPWELYPGGRHLMWRWASQIMFYDYTKNYQRYLGWLGRKGAFSVEHLRGNYHLTLSWNEKLPPWQVLVEQILGAAIDPVDVVMSFVWKGECPSEFAGLPVICGDDHDLTFVHRGPVALALKAKGAARKAGRHDGRFVVTPEMWKEVGAR